MKIKKLLAAALAAVMLIASVGCSSTSAPAVKEVSGDFEGAYDVVVVGFGGAGATAAIAAAREGANVLIVEKAPEGGEGGNTRYAGQMFAYGKGDYDKTLEYYKALAGDKEVNEANLEVLVSHIAVLADEVAEFYNGIEKDDLIDSKLISTATLGMSPEYPGLPGSESVELWATHKDGISDGYFWSVMRKNVVENNKNIDVWFDSPAVDLIQDSASGAVIGVEVERDGKAVKVLAKNGVVMACGGYENNREMLIENLGLTESAFSGTEYNTGDGFAMMEKVNAKLINMDVYEGMAGGLRNTTAAVEGRTVYYTSYLAPSNTGSVILVDGDGNRFANETLSPRHGHVLCENGYYELPTYTGNGIYLILTNTQYKTALAYQVAVPAEDSGIVWYGKTVEELAEKIGTANLAVTVKKFNTFVENGNDEDFSRSPETMAAIADENGYYAVKMVPVILNTQGGPEKNVNAEVIDNNGNVIPHLYVAGEFGGITSLQYQGGTNIAECIVWGRIAGTNAAQPKDDVKYSETTVNGAEYSIGVMTDLTVEKDYSYIELGENQYLGVSANGMGGDIVVRVTYTDGVITAVEVVEQNETPEKYAPVEAKIPAAIVENNSTEVDVVASSTVSSVAIIEAVNNALAQVK